MPYNTVREAFHAVWGLRLHVGYFDEPGLPLSLATLNATRRKAIWAGLLPSANLLEIGCGFARDAETLSAEFGLTVTATDKDAWRLERARVLIGEQSKVVLRQADHRALPYPNASFDAVWATETLYASPDPVRSVCEAARVLRPGGRLVTQEPYVSALINSRPIAALLDATHLLSQAGWAAAWRCAGLVVLRKELWTEHAKHTYLSVWSAMNDLAPRTRAVSTALANMAARLTWIDRNAFGSLVAILEKPHPARPSPLP